MKTRIEKVPPQEEVLTPVTYRRTWIIWRNVIMPHTSSRKVLDDMSVTFANCRDVELQNYDGTPYELPDLDEVFGNDCEMRSFRHFLEADSSGWRPRRISRKPERLRVLIAYIKVKHPRFSKYLGKH